MCSLDLNTASLGLSGVPLSCGVEVGEVSTQWGRLLGWKGLRGAYLPPDTPVPLLSAGLARHRLADNGWRECPADCTSQATVQRQPQVGKFSHKVGSRLSRVV